MSSQSPPMPLLQPANSCVAQSEFEVGGVNICAQCAGLNAQEASQDAQSVGPKGSTHVSKPSCTFGTFQPTQAPWIALSHEPPASLSMLGRLDHFGDQRPSTRMRFRPNTVWLFARQLHESARQHTVAIDEEDAVCWGRINAWRQATCIQSIHLPELRDAFYQVVEVEAGPETDNREIACRVCGAPLVGREGKFVLKCFLSRKAITASATGLKR